MFSEVEIDRDVAVCVKHSKGLSPPHQQILSRLLLDLKNERACKEHGFYLAITSLKSIGNKHNKRDHYNNHQSQVLTTTFPVSFTCRTFLPSRGDILQGVVHNVLWAGVFISSGPLRYAFLSLSKMPPDYRYFPANSDGEEEPCFRRDDLTKIAVGVVVRFEVLAVRFKKSPPDVGRNDIYVLATLQDDDTLGPLSLTGADEPYM
ncbi:unnamed protein product [Cochlearia groenlandica]